MQPIGAKLPSTGLADTSLLETEPARDDELPAYCEIPVAGGSLTGPPPQNEGPMLLPPPSALPLTARTYVPPTALDASALEGPLWDSHAEVALNALDTLMRLHPRGIGQEDLLCDLARHSPSARIRIEATDRLGEIPSVRAADRLLELFWWGDAQIQAQAKFRLSPGTVQDLCYAAKDAPDKIDRCLRDLVLYAPSDSQVPEEALWALRTRSETSHASACDALCDIAARCPDTMAVTAYEALQACATPDDWREYNYGEKLQQSVMPEVARAALRDAR